MRPHGGARRRQGLVHRQDLVAASAPRRPPGRRAGAAPLHGARQGLSRLRHAASRRANSPATPPAPSSTATRSTPTSPRRAVAATPATTRSSARASAASPSPIRDAARQDGRRGRPLRSDRAARPRPARRPRPPGARPHRGISAPTRRNEGNDRNARPGPRRLHRRRPHLRPACARVSGEPECRDRRHRRRQSRARRERGRGPGAFPTRRSTPTTARSSTTDTSTPSTSSCPHHLHCEAALAAIDAGKHVSLQKVMTTTLADADRLVERAKTAKGVFRVFENFIFYPPVMKAKELIDEGAIGTPVSIRIKSNPGRSRTAWEVPAAADAWRQDRRTNGGGPLAFDDGHHKFALGWHFMGLAEEVHAWIGETPRPDRGGFVDAPGIISWKFPGNRYGHLELVYSPDLEIVTVHYAQDDRLEITGTAGVITIARGHGRIVEGPALDAPRRRQDRKASASPTPNSAGRRASSTRPGTGSRRSATAPRRTSPARRGATSCSSRSPRSFRPSSAARSGSTRSAGSRHERHGRRGLRGCSRPFRFRPYSRQGVRRNRRAGCRLGWWLKGAVASKGSRHGVSAQRESVFLSSRQSPGDAAFQRLSSARR